MTTTNEPGQLTGFIDRLATPAVRMLANAVFAPPLLQMLSISKPLATAGVASPPSFTRNDHLHKPVFTLTPYYQNWLLLLDANAKPLHDHINDTSSANSKRRLKLGIYHERLWQFFLANNHNTHLLASNLKVKRENQDLGEFDLIYQHRDIGLVHLEIASKYYLASAANTEQWHVWLGPGKQDRLDLKLEHCIGKQINLADSLPAQQQLHAAIDHKRQVFDSEISASKNADTHLLCKQLHIGGRLFYRYPLTTLIAAISGKEFDTQPKPNKLNAEHYSGHWLTVSEWKTFNNDWLVSSTLVEKLSWLDTAYANLASRAREKVKDSDIDLAMHRYQRSSLSETSLNKSDVKNSGDNDGGSPVMALYSSANGAQHYCFVVPDNWAEQK